MDSRKRIAQYIKPSFFQKILAWLSLALFLFCLLTGIVKAVINGRTQAKQFDSMAAEKYKPYYIDVVGVSDWFLKEIIDNRSHEYRIVLDRDNFYNVVEISANDMQKMGAQAAYWRGDSDVPPEPYRLSGWALLIDEKNDLSNSLYRVSDVGSFSELKARFGDVYLSTFKTGSLDIYFVGALAFGLIAVFAMIFYLSKRTVMKRCLDSMEADGSIKQASEELERCAPEGKCTFGSRFFFAKHEGVAVPYQSITKCLITRDGVTLTAASFLNCSVKMKPESIDRLVTILENRDANKDEASE